MKLEENIKLVYQVKVAIVQDFIWLFGQRALFQRSQVTSQSWESVAQAVTIVRVVRVRIAGNLF